MEEADPILPTLENFLEHLLDLEHKLRGIRKLWTNSLEVNQPWISYIKDPSPRNKGALKLEMDVLNQLITDCKTAMLEFIPTNYQPLSVAAYGHLYVISKVPGLEARHPLLIVKFHIRTFFNPYK